MQSADESERNPNNNFSMLTGTAVESKRVTLDKDDEMVTKDPTASLPGRRTSQTLTQGRVFKNALRGGLLGGSVVKNPPANAGDMGLILGPGRSHMPHNN